MRGSTGLTKGDGSLLDPFECPFALELSGKGGQHDSLAPCTLLPVIELVVGSRTGLVSTDVALPLMELRP